MKFIDLFAGIGGIRQAFESIGGECVFTSEWDLPCQKTYSANYGCDVSEITGDITEVHEKDIPAHDVLLAGFPCQPFSIAGVSKRNSLGSPHGFLCDMQGTLFFDVARIIAYHQPKAFLLENVKNLISHDKGNTFKVIMKTLEEDLGYQVKFKVINSKGRVPQSRQRIYIVGFKDANGFTFDDFPFPDEKKGPKFGSILHRQDGTELIEEPYTTGKNGKVAKKYILSQRLWSYLKQHAEKHKKRGNGFGYGLTDVGDVARTLSARYYKDGSEILVKRGNGRPRRMTPRECARIMGYDDDFKIVVSDTQAYKQFGNSVVVPVLKDIALHMKPWIDIAVKSNSKKTPTHGIGVEKLQLETV